jgi:capsular polysaccharide transport system permease protein
MSSKAEAPAASVSSKPELSTELVFEALCTQLRVINALVLRETKSRYGEHKLGFLWAILEPALMVTVFVAFFSATRTSNPSGMPLVLFMITGFVPFMIFRDTMNQLQGAIVQNRSLIAFPQVTTFDVIIARAVLAILVLLSVFAVLISMAHMLGYDVRIENPLGVLSACMLLALLGLGMGFIFASLVPIIPSMSQFGTLVLGRPLFLGSGLFYTAESLPPVVREWLLYNPILHMIELGRSAFFYEFESRHGDWRYAVIFTICTLALGMVAHQSLRRRAIIGL